MPRQLDGQRLPQGLGHSRLGLGGQVQEFIYRLWIDHETKNTPKVVSLRS